MHYFTIDSVKLRVAVVLNTSPVAFYTLATNILVHVFVNHIFFTSAISIQKLCLGSDIHVVGTNHEVVQDILRRWKRQCIELITERRNVQRRIRW